jgi:hypothetical protein
MPSAHFYEFLLNSLRIFMRVLMESDHGMKISVETIPHTPMQA